MHPTISNEAENLACLCQRYHVKQLEVFGSGAGEAFKPEESDVDFLVVFAPCSPEEHADRYFGLLADLQDLLERNIDLVELNAIRNPHFLETIQRTRTPIYAA